MIRSLIRFVLPALTGALFASSAYAQSCNPIEMTPEQIEKTDVIFIGQVVTKNYDPNKIVNHSVYRARKDPLELDDSKKLKATYLLVTIPWKGVQEDEIVKIWTDAEFSENYELDNQYLMGGNKYVKPVVPDAEKKPAAGFSKKDDKKVPPAEFEIPACGLSFHYPSYDQKKKHYNFFGESQLKAIKAYFAEKEAKDAADPKKAE